MGNNEYDQGPLALLPYWRQRVIVMANALIEIKMRKDGVSRSTAEMEFWAWSRKTTGMVAAQSASLDQCKLFVTIYHKIRSGNK